MTITYTKDQTTATQTAVIDGRVSYLLFGGKCQEGSIFDALALAPFVASHGTWSEPLPKTVSATTLQYGTDVQLGINTAGLLGSYFYVSPYYQTDYQAKGRLQGIVLGWEPVVKELALGEKNDQIANRYYTFFWQVRPEADFIDVYASGLTNLSTGRHTLLGASLQATLGLFPLTPHPEPWWYEDLIAGRISLIGTISDFRDSTTQLNSSIHTVGYYTTNHVNADYYTATLKYALGECKRTNPGGQTSPAGFVPAVAVAKLVAAKNACTIQGSSAISLEYDWGTDKSTLVYVKRWIATLSYAY
jgi:hypothetical protein